MREQDAQFEQQLSRDLKGLANYAPAEAGIHGLQHRLRRRAMRRTAGGVSAAIAAIAIAAAWLGLLQRAMQPPLEPGAAPGRMVAQSSLPEPIPADAGAQQIQAAVFGYLSSVGVHGQVLICKERGDPLYYVVNGDVGVRPEQLHDYLAAMLRSFEAISIERRGRDVRCTLVAAGPANNTNQSQQYKEHV